MAVRRLLNLIVVVLVSLSALLAPASLAQEATPSGTSLVLPPDAEVDGMDLSEWTARFAQWMTSFPLPVNPALDETGERCGYGQSGPVFFLAPFFMPGPAERTCLVPDDVVVYFSMGGAGCSSLEEPPYYGGTEEELLTCARDNAATIPITEAFGLTINGEDVPDLASYYAESPVYTFAAPADNWLGVAPGVGRGASAGYQLLLGPFPAGQHEIIFTTPGTGGTPTPYTIILDVRSPIVDGAPGATPVS
jgi:hypothetical protein